MRQLNFHDHRRELGDNLYVYPVISRRAGGLSVGVNLNPDKVCNFDCPYCQVDRRTPGGAREVDLDRLTQELTQLLGGLRAGWIWEQEPFSTAQPQHRVLKDVSLAGDGEPCSCPQFSEAVERVADCLEASQLPGVKLQLLTNASLFHRPRVWAGLEEFTRRGGVIWGKLDAGTEPYFQLVEGTRLPFQRILDNLLRAAQLSPLVLQCMFLTLEGRGPSEAELQAWQRRVAWIVEQGGAVAEVQVYTVARRPSDSRVGALALSDLEKIGRLVDSLGLKVSVHPGRYEEC